MAKEFRLPDIGEGLTEAEVVRWLVGVGAKVKVDQPVVEVETDKAAVEIPAPYAGVVLHHGAAEGETLEVGQILLVIGEPGESWPPSEEDFSSGQAGPQPEARAIVGTLSEEAEQLPSRAEGAATQPSRRQALPVVRKLAKDLGVELDGVEGTGPGGRITREDVLAAAQSAHDIPSVVPDARDEVAVDEPVAEEEPPETGPPEDERVRLTKLRRTIAANMSRAWQEIPHVTTFDSAEATRLLAARSSLQARHGVQIPLEALVIKAVLPALSSFPELNATLDGDELILKRRHDVGVAVDTDEGLVVAVLRDADRLGLLGLSAEVTRLAKGAQARSLPPSELSGQSFTVSNIGALGGGFGTPIVPPGTTAILSVGRAADQAVVREGRVEVAPMFPLSLSYDHRVIDGGLGRRFMAVVLENLEEPTLFLAG
ncbi:MAG: dihydrolipoamide acetyltransferase family protein [Acidimicrobiia bacterium]